jgi:hypothetical protein
VAKKAVEREKVYAQLGDERDTSVLLLPTMYSPVGSKNLRIIEKGVMQTVDGYITKNPASRIEDINTNELWPVGLWEYVNPSTGIRSLLFLGFPTIGPDVEFHHSTDGGVTWSRLLSIGTILVGPASADQLGDFLYINIKDVGEYKYNGTTVVAAGQARPAAVTTAVATDRDRPPGGPDVHHRHIYSRSRGNQDFQNDW